MALQASGTISISQIRTELLKRGTNSYSLRALSSGAGKSVPDAMSEFYSFEGCYPYGTFSTSYCNGYDLYYRYHDGSCGFYDVLVEGGSPTCGCVTYETLCNQYCSGCDYFVEVYGDGYCGCNRALNYGRYGDPDKKLFVNCYTYVSQSCAGYNQYQYINYRCNTDSSVTFTDVIVNGVVC
jgi:hypothetical protein